MINLLKKFMFFCGQLFIYPKLTIRAICNLPRFGDDFYQFRKRAGGAWPIKFFPVLLERTQPSAMLGEYFWQDLFVAKKIIESDPNRHIDVGSRIDGFVAHLACVRRVEVFDIRPLDADIGNLKFVQWDITSPNDEYRGVADCVSCLHTLEHIGLGRYGDKLDAEGWKKGLRSLAELISQGGELWLSVPIGAQRVEFNAHRVFNPITIINEAIKNNLSLSTFYFLHSQGVQKSNDLEADCARLGKVDYALGIYHFYKN
jgi:Caenorhabditis protein of unknown function, DUF268